MPPLHAPNPNLGSTPRRHQADDERAGARNGGGGGKAPLGGDGAHARGLPDAGLPTGLCARRPHPMPRTRRAPVAACLLCSPPALGGKIPLPCMHNSIRFATLLSF